MKLCDENKKREEFLEANDKQRNNKYNNAPKQIEMNQKMDVGGIDAPIEILLIFEVDLCYCTCWSVNGVH